MSDRELMKDIKKSGIDKIIKDSPLYKMILAQQEADIRELFIQMKNQNPRRIDYDCSNCGRPQILLFGGTKYKTNPQFIKMTTEYICKSCYFSLGVMS